jgi:hypothetical protein
MVNVGIAKVNKLGTKDTFAILDEKEHTILVKKMNGAAWITIDLFRLIGERFNSSAAVGKYLSDTLLLLYSLGVSTGEIIIEAGGKGQSQEDLRLWGVRFGGKTRLLRGSENRVGHGDQLELSAEERGGHRVEAGCQ